jgi:hypothetical protein
MPADVRAFTTRAYREGDERAILELFARAFPHAPRSREHFRWKYRDDPFGNERISLTFEGERLVGHYAGYVVPFWYLGTSEPRNLGTSEPRYLGGRGTEVPRHRGTEVLLANQIGDTMTDVSVRTVGRGPTSIVGRTALHFYENFCDNRVAFNYGFNVGNIQKISTRFLRSDVVEPVTYRARDLRAHPLKPMSRFERWSNGFRFEIVRHTDAAFDDLFARASPHYVFLVRRDARYVQWRYLQCPDVPYHVVAIRKWRRLVGWIVFRIREDRFTWGDALFDPRFPDAAQAVLRHLVPMCPVTAIEGWFPPRPRWFDLVLRELQMDVRPEPQDLSLMCVPFVMQDAVARMRESLYFTWGDSDLF